jgi:hypothetical protein
MKNEVSSKIDTTNVRQAIVTRYLPATNFRGSRIKASCERGSITVSYPHELSGAQCHAFAVGELLKKFWNEDGPTNHWGVPGDWVCSALPDASRDAYVFVRKP